MNRAHTRFDSLEDHTAINILFHAKSYPLQSANSGVPANCANVHIVGESETVLVPFTLLEPAQVRHDGECEFMSTLVLCGIRRGR